MRFPSFIRVARNKRFEIEPRYYDPIKEEIEERTARIKEELKGESGDSENYKTRISFERRSTSAQGTSIIQLAIAGLLGLMVVGWLQFGNDVLYILWLIVPVYFYFRFRKPRR